jgi:SAM-dependent methyltransferase
MVARLEKNGNGAVSALTIFLGAFLLFALEPLVAKRILPWFGGSAAVWSTCLVFYQTALLLGYAYARWLSNSVSGRAQGLIHLSVLAASLLLLPIGPAERWKPTAASGEPAWLIVAMLSATIGLPFVILSATSPLLQAWLARSGHPAPYRFFALSNFASLAALLAYPTLVEPNLTASGQSVWWSALYLFFVVACAAAALRGRERPGGLVEAPLAGARVESQELASEPHATRHKLSWFALATCGSMLLLSVTNHIDENVAGVPLLWVLPLAIYLLSFVLGFGAPRFYRRDLWLRLLALALGMLGYATYNIDTVQALQISLPIFLAGLFICCVFLHSELNRCRPDGSNLTSFYLTIAFGGAVGAVFVGLIAPEMFGGIYELPITLCLTAALALALTWSSRQWAVRILWTAVTACMVAVFAANIAAYGKDALTLRRSFYGSLRVVQSPHAGPEQTRTLFHGTVEHGAEFLWPERQRQPTAYYGPESGIGIVMREGFEGPKRVAIVGLGTGTIAAYGKSGDVLRFYEINRQVIDIAQSLFFFTRETAAQVEVIEGDARLSLERETGERFDVLALDAFSGDAIPIHLLTREAMGLFKSRLRPNGVIAFHLSNNYLELAPMVMQLAEEAGFRAVDVRSHEHREDLVLAAEWMLVTNNRSILDNDAVKVHTEGIEPRPGIQPWTDGFNNLLQVLKRPTLR